MPTPPTTDLPRPRSWDEFEDLCTDVLKRVWNDPNVVRHGRTGQRQQGVDIYGRPAHLGGAARNNYAGAQCKETGRLDIATIIGEINKATEFVPALAEYLIMTTAPRDSSVQRDVRTREWPFPVQLMFWEDICLELSGHDDLLQKHFPGWFQRTTSADQVANMISSSQPSDFNYDDATGVYTHNRDIKLKIILDRTEDNCRDFAEQWVSRFSDPHATCQPVYIHYGESRVSTHHFAYVDGGRFLVPYPKSGTELRIDKFQYHLGCIMNNPLPGYGFDHALSVAGITVG